MMNSATPAPRKGQRSEPSSEGDRVPSRFRPRLTYANVMSTIAVFIALGGSSYAAVTLNGKNIKYRSVSASKIKRNTLTTLEIRESRLTTVPKARIADNLSVTGAEALLRCPGGTTAAVGTCLEVTPRGEATYGSAVRSCSLTGTALGDRRRLPTHGELLAAFSQSGVVEFRGPELTSDVYPSATLPGGLDVLYVTTAGGSVAVIPNDSNGARLFRCAVDPIPVGRRP
jgi:hypothetical protein